jgi:hypothetical protein
VAKLGDLVQNTLDECRMLILGGQVLISFSAQSVLQPGFQELSAPGRLACGVAMVAEVAAVSLLMWPAAYHRIVCGGEDEPRLFTFAMCTLSLGLAPFALGLCASFYVVGERIGAAPLAIGAALAAAAAAITAWYVFPHAARLRRRNSRKESMSSTTPSQAATPLEHKIRHVLTEARMVLPGAQALLGFGTIAVLSDGFDELPQELKLVHLVSLGLIGLATVLLMSTSAYHRIAESGELSERFHRIATRLMLAALALLAPGMAGGLWLVVEQVSGRRALAATTAIAAVLLCYAAWFGSTWLIRRRAG